MLCENDPLYVAWGSNSVSLPQQLPIPMCGWKNPMGLQTAYSTRPPWRERCHYFAGLRCFDETENTVIAKDIGLYAVCWFLIYVKN